MVKNGEIIMLFLGSKLFILSLLYVIKKLFKPSFFRFFLSYRLLFSLRSLGITPLASKIGLSPETGFSFKDIVILIIPLDSIVVLILNARNLVIDAKSRRLLLSRSTVMMAIVFIWNLR